MRVMEPALRDILTSVREGRLDPAEAARLLQERSTATEHTPSTGGPPADPQPSSDAPSSEAPIASSAVWASVTDDPDPASDVPDAREPSTPTVRTDEEIEVPTEATDDPQSAIIVDNRATTGLRIRAITRRVRIIGDPAVTTVSIDGPHELRREGTTLICDSERDLPFGDPFAFLPTAMGRFRLQAPGQAFTWGTALEVRVNPELDLDIDLTAGSLHVEQVGRVRARVTAGSARVEDIRGPLDLHIVGGTAKIDTVMVGGGNRVRCDSGSVLLHLRPGSDLRFRPEAQLGRIVIDGAEGGREITVGRGTGRLRAEVVMGSIQVEVGR